MLLAHYVKPPHVPEHLDIFVESMLSTRVGEYSYPGDSRPVDAWPGFAPGDRGVLNTMAPTHFRIADLSGVEPKPPVLWLRGADDVIVSDTSLYDLGYLGSIGAIPGWPGETGLAAAADGGADPGRRRPATRWPAAATARRSSRTPATARTWTSRSGSWPNGRITSPPAHRPAHRNCAGWPSM